MNIFRSIISFLLVINLGLGSFLPPGYAQSMQSLSLPAPGMLVSLSAPYVPAIFKGVTIHPDNPFLFDFIVDTGHSGLSGDVLVQETTKMVKYFLASLATPEEDLWVNLSPYESDRIIPEKLGITEMGKDLLAQDYILKQTTASLIYPENDVGRRFWEKVYKRIYETYGTTDAPINTFNKVWIVPEKAVVFRQGDTAYIADSRLKVMLDEDFLALQRNLHNEEIGTDKLPEPDVQAINSISAKIMQEIVLPLLEEEINTGKNFALLRQIYRAHVLASWYKKTLRESLLGKVYVDQKKIAGVDIEDKDLKQKIYEQYVEAYRKGVYSYIREEYDLASQENVHREYVSGGMLMGLGDNLIETEDAAQLTADQKRNVARSAGDNRRVTFTFRINEKDTQVPVKVGIKGKEKRIKVKGVPEFYEIPKIPEYDSLPPIIQKAIGKPEEIGYFFRMLWSRKTELRKLAIRRITTQVRWRTSFDDLKDIYKFLNDYNIFGGAKQALYDAYVNKTNLNLMQIKAAPQAAWMGAVETIIEFQNWLKGKEAQDSEKFFIMALATGQTQEMFIKFLVDIMNNWGDEKLMAELKKFGVDPNLKPDFRRVISFHLDTEAPQDRTDYFAFSELIRYACDALGIPKNQQNFFFGDWIYYKDWENRESPMRKMSPAILKALKEDIEKNKLLLNDFLNQIKEIPNGEEITEEDVPMARKSPLQFRFYMAMRKQNELLSKKLEDLGGPHIVFGSFGLSYKGEAHFAFIETMMGLIKRAFMGVSGHHNIAGVAAYSGGLEKYMWKTIFATFSFRDLFQRKGVKVILTVLNHNKQQALKQLMEGDVKNFPQYPPLYFQKHQIQGAVIFDKAAGEALWMEQFPWDVKLFTKEDWDEETIRCLLMHVAWFRKKNIRDLYRKDLLNYGFAGKVPRIIARTRQENLKILLEQKSLKEFIADIIKRYEENIIKPEELVASKWGRKYVREMARRVSLRTGIQKKILAARRSGAQEKEITKLYDDLNGTNWDLRAALENIKRLGKLRRAMEKNRNLSEKERNKQSKQMDKQITEWRKEAKRLREKRKETQRGLWKRVEANKRSLIKDLFAADWDVVKHGKIFYSQDPHPDDRFLALPFVIRALRAQGHRVVTMTVTTGASAVNDKYVREIYDYVVNELLGENVSLAEKVKIIREAINLSRKDYSIALTEETRKRPFINEEQYTQFDAWDRQTPAEKRLRAMILLNYVYHKLFNRRGLKNKNQINNFYKFITFSFDNKRDWGARNHRFVDKIKGFIRITEEKTAMLNDGNRYEDIFDPREQAWYTSVGKAGMPSDEDIESNVGVVERLGHIDSVIGNDEPNSDGGAHQANQVMLNIMIPKLIEKGIIKNLEDFFYLGFCGVWYVRQPAAADILIGYTQEQDDLLNKEMWLFYPSQTAPQTADGSWDKLLSFSQGVVINGQATLQKLMRLFGFSEKIKKKIDPKGMVLAFNVKNIADPKVWAEWKSEVATYKEHREELKRTATEIIYGLVPLPGIFRKGGYGIRDVFDDFYSFGGEDLLKNVYWDYIKEKTLRRGDVFRVLSNIMEKDLIKNRRRVARKVYRQLVKEFEKAEKSHNNSNGNNNFYTPTIKSNSADEANITREGGIYLAGTDQYLQIIDYDNRGLPIYDAGQLQQLQMNLIGITPVPVGPPVPLPAFNILGNFEKPTQPKISSQEDLENQGEKHRAKKPWNIPKFSR